MAKANKAITATTEQEFDKANVELMLEPLPNETSQPAVEVDASGRKKSVDLTMEFLLENGLKNKSQVIRYLDANGYARSAIAGFLNVRYQHVRNVLVTPLKKGG